MKALRVIQVRSLYNTNSGFAASYDIQSIGYTSPITTKFKG